MVSKLGLQVPLQWGYGLSISTEARNLQLSTTRAAWIGGRPNARSEDSFTVLMWAAARGHVEVVKLLLEAGADLNARTRKGRTAIEIGTQEGHHDIVEVLREAGANDRAIVSESREA